MDIIPVIDLLQGQVVHAKRGERHRYRPIESCLCPGSDPLEIIHVLLELYPFKSIYIADLDAIQQLGDHRRIVGDIRQNYPHLDIWLDAGIAHPDQLEIWHPLELTTVIGSESMKNMDQYVAVLNRLDPFMTVLSLDFGPDGLLGPQELLEKADAWPSKVIAMTLKRVGSSEGADTALLGKLISKRNDLRVYAAGGIRHMHDIRQLEKMGVAGALIASALHQGTINAGHLTQ